MCSQGEMHLGFKKEGKGVNQRCWYCQTVSEFEEHFGGGNYVKCIFLITVHICCKGCLILPSIDK